MVRDSVTQFGKHKGGVSMTHNLNQIVIFKGINGEEIFAYRYANEQNVNIAGGFEEIWLRLKDIPRINR